MIEFIQMGGIMMWPILLCILLMVGMSARAVLARRGIEGRRPGQGRSDVDSVLFWGFAAAVLGVLGTLLGVIQMASAIERAGMVQTSTIWSGIKVTLATSIAGVGTLLVALLLWMALRAVLLRERPGREAVGT